jgi:hypothetical protein
MGIVCPIDSAGPHGSGVCHGVREPLPASGSANGSRKFVLATRGRRIRCQELRKGGSPLRSAATARGDSRAAGHSGSCGRSSTSLRKEVQPASSLTCKAWASWTIRVTAALRAVAGDSICRSRVRQFVQRARPAPADIVRCGLCVRADRAQDCGPLLPHRGCLTACAQHHSTIWRERCPGFCTRAGCFELRGLLLEAKTLHFRTSSRCSSSIRRDASLRAALGPSDPCCKAMARGGRRFHRDRRLPREGSEDLNASPASASIRL